MNLLDTINQDLKTAMKAGDDTRKRTLRSLKTAITRAEKETGDQLSEDDILAVIRRQVKQRRDSIAAYQQANRADLVAAEQAELAVLQEYLPPEVDADTLRAAAREIITQTGASSMRDMGKVMGPMMARFKNQADGRLVNQIVRELLSGQ